MPKKKSKKTDVVTYVVKAASLLDLVRNACTISSAPLIFASKQGEKYRLMLTAERLNDARVLYYFDTDKIAKFCIYRPVGENESIEMKDSIDGEEHDYKTYKVQIMELLNNPFADYFGDKAPQSKTDLLIFKVKDYESIIRGSLSIAAESEKMGKVYYFENNGKKYICSFGEMDDSSNAVVYAEVGTQNLFNFIHYNYTNNKIEFLKALEGSTSVPLAVIRLAEPFPFFKPE
jgi:hypothetical protein